MSTCNVTLEIGERQGPAETFLSPADRRILLGAELRLLARRFSHGKPIFHDDIVRAASLADDVDECAR